MNRHRFIRTDRGGQCRTVRRSWTLLSALLCLVSLALGLTRWQSPNSGGLTSAGAQEANRPRLQAQTGHGGIVTGVCFSRDGKLMATAATDGSVRIWHAGAGKLIREITIGRGRGESDSAPQVCFDLTGTQLVHVGAELHVIEVLSGKARKLGDLLGIETASFAADGKTVVVLSAEGCFAIDVLTGTAKELNVTGHEVTSLEGTRDGKSAIMGTSAGWLLVVNISSGQVLASNRIGRTEVTRIRASADRSRYFVQIGTSIECVNAGTLASIRRIPVQGEILGFAGTTDLVVVLADDSMTETNLASGKRNEIATSLGDEFWDEDEADEARAVALSPDGREVAVCGATWTVHWATSLGGNRFIPEEPALTRVVPHWDNVALVPWCAAASPDGSMLVVGHQEGDIVEWDLGTGSGYTIPRHYMRWVTAIAFAPDGSFYVSAGPNGVIAHEARSGRTQANETEENATGATCASVASDGTIAGLFPEEIRFYRRPDFSNTSGYLVEVSRYRRTSEIDAFGFLASGSTAAIPSNRGIALVDGTTGKESAILSYPERFSVGYDADTIAERRVFCTTSPTNRDLLLGDLTSGFNIYRIRLNGNTVESVLDIGLGGGLVWAAFSSSGDLFCAATDFGSLRIWETATGKQIASWDIGSQVPEAVGFLGASSRVYVLLPDGLVRIYEVNQPSEICSLASFQNRTWAVAAADGRFDTNSFDDGAGLHWLPPSDPLSPLGIEAFMRQYYEPRLLAKLLNGVSLSAVPSLAGLNLNQPIVEITSVTSGSNRTATVTMKVRAPASGGAGRKSGAHDLRLFRDGRLVRQVSAELLGESEVEAEFVEEGIPLPTSGEEVEFAAYCFNDSEVKSPSAKFVFPLPAGAEKKGRVYAISVGIDGYESEALSDLKYAANDARTTSAALEDALAESDLYDEVVAVALISEVDGDANAGKEIIRTVIEVLGGRSAPPDVLARIPDAGKLKKATPDDLVFLSWAGHGFAGGSGRFFLVPQDAKGRPLDETSCVSTDELSEWLKGVDAGEFVFVLDACQSASAFQEEGFRPGPMGTKGFGQLAYDKGMLLLAATQAEDTALESGRLQHGLLTYALVQEGLRGGRAADDGVVLLLDWLRYAVWRVPEIYDALRSGREITGTDGRAVVVSAGGVTEAKSRSRQTPMLFDFLLKRPDVTLEAGG